MKVWINTSFKGFYPVGTAAVVVADNAGQAASLLYEALAAQGLVQNISAADMKLQPTNKPTVNILLNGNY